jgi:putative PIN family toxin of toxin-antitoxin system
MLERGFVLDTNVIVSAALFPDSVPRRAFEKAIDLGKPLLSAEFLEELHEVLNRKRFDRYVSQESRKGFLATLVDQGVFLEVQDSIQVCRDPKDDKFLDLAVAGQATCLITGDEDLLVLNPFRGIPIVTPRQFLEEFVPDEDRPVTGAPNDGFP